MGAALGKTIMFFSVVCFVGLFLPALGIVVYEKSLSLEVSKNVSNNIIFGCFILVFLIAFYIEHKNGKRG